MDDFFGKIVRSLIYLTHRKANIMFFVSMLSILCIVLHYIILERQREYLNIFCELYVLEYVIVRFKIFNLVGYSNKYCIRSCEGSRAIVDISLIKGQV